MSPGLSLALFKARILFVDYVQLAFPAHDLAINASFFDGCSYFHVCNIYRICRPLDYLYLKMILPLDKS